MIKIEAPKTDRIYNILTSYGSVGQTAGEEWRDAIVGDVRTIRLGPLELEQPLDFLNQTIIRNSNSYSSIVEVFARQEKSFQDLSADFIDKINERKLYFLPTTNHLTGYITKSLEGEIYPLATIIENQAGKSRAIGMGAFGSKQILLDGPSNFRIEMGRLNDMVNDIIGTVYESVFGKRKTGSPNINLSFLS